MGFEVNDDRQPAAPSGMDRTVVLEDRSAQVRAEIWPAGGFNCTRWRIGHLEMLYGDALFGPGGKATRGGIPILFPFPNRIRDGRFSWEGTHYRLPANDPSGKNAIHGFACRKQWRVIDRGADAHSAWVTGEFHGLLDAPETAALWPTDYRIRVVVRLSGRSLTLDAAVDNPDGRALPFGLGYHPYFRVPFTSAGEAAYTVAAPAESTWELAENLPTGRQQRPDTARDLNRPRSVAELNLDDAYTGLPSVPDKDGLCLHGVLRQTPPGLTMEIRASPAFRELVAFTPPHRQAICLEPYTCVTDAVNLQTKGIDSGWLVLPPHKQWTGRVEMTCESSPAMS
jgi:aldose 1-epimerase